MLVSPHETLDFRGYFRAEARSVEHAVMTDSSLEMMLPLVMGKILAQNLCSVGLTDPRDVVLLSFHGHKRNPLDFIRIHAAVAVRHHPPRQLMVQEHRFDGLQVI